MKSRQDEKLSIQPAHLIHLLYHAKYVEKEKMHHPLGSSYLLPDTSQLFEGSKFADIAFGYNEEGVVITVNVHHAFLGVNYPEFQEGDALVLFLDTRDFKDSAFNSKFCHQFVILPKDYEGIQVIEVTKFRSYDKRELMDSSLIEVSSSFKKNSYQMHIVIPQEALYGYDLSITRKLGFSTILYSVKASMQCFAASPIDFKLEEMPSLYASFKLV